jgi:hypothetical protein
MTRLVVSDSDGCRTMLPQQRLAALLSATQCLACATQAEQEARCRR